jgi:hypothetical protein
MKITLCKRSILWVCGLLVVLIGGWFSYCPAPEYTLGDDRSIPIYVSYHNWHSAVGWRQAEGENLGAEPWRSAPIVEFGWGDRDFFWGGDESWLSILRMAVLPSPSVIHGASLPTTVDRWLQVPMQTLYVDRGAWRRLKEYVQNSFALDDQGNRQIVGEGQYGSRTPSTFFSARPLYSLWWNCNTWSAHALHYAGLPLCPRRVWLVQQLQAQLQQVQSPPNH